MFRVVLVLALGLTGAAAPVGIERARAAERAGQYRQMADEARQARRSCPDDPCRAEAWNLEGSAFYYLGHYEDAVRGYGEALAVFQRVGDVKKQAAVLTNLGGIAFVRGQYLDAWRSYDQADALQAGQSARYSPRPSAGTGPKPGTSAPAEKSR